MKFIFLTLFVIVYLMDATTEAQWLQRCPGADPVNCNLPLDVGTNCTTTRRRRMWYFDTTSRTCRDMTYLGCGGNANRFCTWVECLIKCPRRFP